MRLYRQTLFNEWRKNLFLGNTFSNQIWSFKPSPSGLNDADGAKVSVHSSFAGLLNYQIVNVLELVAAEIVI